MKTNRDILRFSRNFLIGVGLALGAALSLDAQTVIAAGGNAITGGNFYLGTHASSPSGLLLTYDDALTNGVVVKFHANQLAAWLWENGTGSASPTTWPSMKLDLSNNLILYNGNNEGVRLDPVNNKLTLGGTSGAILIASGSTLTTGGAFTVSGALTATSGITNTTGSFTSPTALNLAAGGTNQNITLTPSGSGNLILVPPPSTGNVGIGTILPGQKLTVGAGNITIQDITSANTYYIGRTRSTGEVAASRIQFEKGAGAGNYDFDINLYTSPTGGGAATSKIIVKSNGNVGIGTTNPNEQLEVASSTGGRLIVSDGGAGSRRALLFQGPTSIYNYATIAGYNYGSGTYIPITIQPNGGNVGIGTTSPGQKLAVSLADSDPAVSTTNSIAAIGASGKITAIGANSTYGWLQSYNAPLYINNAGNSTILNGSGTGFVGIGTVAPAASLDVGGYAASGALRTVFARQVEGDTIGSGTFLGVRAWGTQATPYNNKMFSIENTFYGYLNSSIEFYRGGSYQGGFTTFTTGDGTERLRIDPVGNVGIGTTNPTQKLSVAGTVRAYAVVVDTGWSDYVFDKDYRLAPLSEVEQQIKAEKHLPGIPSAADVAEHGVSLGDMQSKLLAKVEELTLHLIEQEKRIQRLEQENRVLRSTQPEVRNDE